MLYVIYWCHNYHFLSYAAMEQGRGREAIEAARGAATTAPVDMLHMMPGMDIFLTPPYAALVDFGRWDEILAEPPPPAGFPFVRGMWHYARGLAFDAKGQPDSAGQERDSVKSIAAAVPEDQPAGFNTAKALLGIASDALGGALASRRGDHDQAVALLRQAVRGEDGLSYDEPPDWMLPARRMLGRALLAAGRARQAEAAFRQDLRRHPENGRSLYGLAKSLEAQNRTREASEVEARFRKAWTRADITPEIAGF